MHLLQTLAHHVIREPLLTLLIHTLRGTLVTHVGQLHHLQPEAHCHLSQLCREEVLITLLFLLLDHGYIISVLMLRTVNTAIKLKNKILFNSTSKQLIYVHVYFSAIQGYCKSSIFSLYYIWWKLFSNMLM